jgi:hypothetical protein
MEWTFNPDLLHGYFGGFRAARGEMNVRSSVGHIRLIVSLNIFVMIVFYMMECLAL